jgi:hypothetical protein
VDIRPVTEAWDIGMVPRPEGLTTRRYMILRKATPATEAGTAPSAPQRQAISKPIADTGGTGTLVATESMRPSARGRRYRNSRDGVSYYDGPFIESKELIGGYIIVSDASLDAVDRWARRYVQAVGASEVDVRELE